jgi:hypothetical protein
VIEETGSGKAYLEFEEWTAAGGTMKRVKFQFNPTDFSVGQEAHWVGDNPEKVEYVGPHSQSMSVSMLLDASEKEDGDIAAEIKELLRSCHPTPTSESKNSPLPPRVRFGWKEVHFEGYVSDVKVKYKLFRPDGRPIRAECDINMKKIERKPARQNPTSGTPAIHRTVEIVAGDTLPGIAYKEYGAPARWRALAAYNGIDDPMRLRPGMQLLVPPAAEAAEVASS